MFHLSCPMLQLNCTYVQTFFILNDKCQFSVTLAVV